MGCLWQVYKALSVLFFTLFLVLLLVGVFLLAGIGAVEIPGLSRLFGFSVEPTPTRHDCKGDCAVANDRK